MNSAIDAGELGAPDVAVVREAFDEFDRVLGVLALHPRLHGWRAALPAALMPACASTCSMAA